MLLLKFNYILLGHLLFLATITVDSASIDESRSAECSPESVYNILNGAKLNDENENELAEQLYEKCSDEFNAHNDISPEVKSTVDTWIGKDISQAEIAELLLSYELEAMQHPMPENPSESFKEDCGQMTKQYELYRETSAVIAQHLHPDSDTLTSEMATIDEDQRKLLNYAIYTQLCNMIVQQD